jgi:autotransporter-associated beta strand protein
VTLSTTVSPGSVTVNNTTGNYTISGIGSIGGTGALTKSGTGTLTLSIPNTYTGGTSVSAGRLVILPTGATSSALAHGALSISGGTLQLADNVTAGTALAASNVNLTSLSMTGSGTLDIGNNRVIVDYSSPATDPIASIAQWIKNGFYNLAGPQIISSDITADDAASGLSYGIGYADGADHVVAGLPSGEIEIMFTLLGDANLDGTVNTEDFTQFSQHLGQSGQSWDDGDFNYDGTVNTEDFTLFSHNLGESDSLAAAAGGLEAADGISLANVPEPGSMGLLTLIAGGLLVRRKRNPKKSNMILYPDENSSTDGSDQMSADVRHDDVSIFFP